MKTSMRGLHAKPTPTKVRIALALVLGALAPCGCSTGGSPGFSGTDAAEARDAGAAAVEAGDESRAAVDANPDADLDAGLATCRCLIKYPNNDQPEQIITYSGDPAGAPCPDTRPFGHQYIVTCDTPGLGFLDWAIDGPVDDANRSYSITGCARWLGSGQPPSLYLQPGAEPTAPPVYGSRCYAQVDQPSPDSGIGNGGSGCCL
jgi:hypothetical protein